MRALVTGADGFLGSAVVRHLLESGYNVRSLIHSDKSFDTLKALDIERVKGDVRDIEAVDRAVKGCGLVFHIASLYKFYPWWMNDDEEIFEINVIGTRNMLDSSLKYGVRRFIYTSSVASIGKRPDNLPSDEETEFNLRFGASQYALSKVEAEKEVLKACKKGLEAIILNPAAIIGPRDYKPTNTGEMIVKFLNKEYAGYFDCALTLVDVDDVARAHVAAIDKGRAGERYILCDSKLYTLRELYNLLEKISGIKAPA
ncbi:MAG: NAD-dependent epimerase/dehydratase family protein, partial [Candidatus Omnitrophica bacterium]|nr:NAD-dependent epimerase/dehydratase family protein [Candidatus Omnitrophota bacterium]